MTAGEQKEDGVVLRLGIRSEAEMFFADKRKPLVGDFDLGTEEAKAAAANRYASLSVWDEDLTKVDEARAFLVPSRRLPIWLSVQAITALEHALSVIRTPHTKDLPGREGHCDIQNVWPTDKSSFKKIRADLRDIATCDRGELTR